VDSGCRHYHVTAACYEHRPLIGETIERMSQFAADWLTVLDAHSTEINAWAVLPNHYHALVLTDCVLPLLQALGKFHGRTSHQWNGEDNARGRQVWCKAVETAMKSQSHYHGTVNYVHHNPVKHGYVKKWTEWPWSSAAAYLDSLGEAEAALLWKKYPVDDYGRGWDDAEF